ncbi:NAD(P)-dependent dehydrogenase (short-subunit alcohol dehydrogenase family) [Sphingopyxis panaciterrae]|uniref:SDR family NAD(P)-dependent oxidoreductase n=1 Tax=Sphingopyxis panaciterrae TaxID=363841 RepID=UPI0014218A68|nr:SDR family oxidoreductase [Sphingopyxis panaciterrae]NIJ35940.1 NAD(P)-dependent dehydrogenase (short-subunit alcohol dehydrogenase family) [Sphingopyxis panaciterrae]
MIERLSLAGRRAIVTGAGAGLGRATATLFAAAGAEVLCVDRNRDAAAEAAEAIGGSFAAVDVIDRLAVREELGAFAGHGVDILANIAGVASSGERVEDMNGARFEQIFAINFKGTLFCIQAVLPAMIAARRGAIVNMVSSAIDLAIPTNASYSISKAAVAMLTKVLANEVGPDGIRVNAVAPGFVPTALSMEAAGAVAADRTAYLDRWAKSAPLGRVGSPEDIAQQCLYLASDASSFVTGQILRANGGTTMPW